MRAIFPVLFAVAVVMSAHLSGADCRKTQPLFVIEHNKNGNAVHYEACIVEDNSLAADVPVIAYWILEDGRREELSGIERQRAYGISLRARPEHNRAVISLVSLKEKEITVEIIDGRYRAEMLIDGTESILDRVYLKSRELLFGLPVVEYIDLFGRTRAKNLPVRERLLKPRSFAAMIPSPPEPRRLHSL